MHNIYILVFQRLEASESENKRLQEREAKTQSELERLKGQHHATIIAEVYSSQLITSYMVEPYILHVLPIVAGQAGCSRARAGED